MYEYQNIATMRITELSQIEYDQYYRRYIDKLSSILDLTEDFEEGMNNVIQFLEAILMIRYPNRYEADKWNIKEIFQHLIDIEKVFMYRCFWVTRNDKTFLAGFDENIYIEPSGANNKSVNALINEFKIVCQGSISFLENITDTHLEFIGSANACAMSVSAAAFTIVGHEIWHMDIIKEDIYKWITHFYDFVL